MAVDDDLIRKNPFGFELASVIVNDSVTREAITRKQERDLLKFIQEDTHFGKYYDSIYILFHTGLRISEFCGLTIPDIEFGEMRIKVDHQLQRTSQMEYVIQEPKMESGVRYVPMTEEVAACFHRMIANRETPKVEPMVDGYMGKAHDYDIVEGFMADDTIYNYVQGFIDGKYSRAAFWELAKFKYPTHQISFHTVRALTTLRFLEGAPVYEK